MTQSTPPPLKVREKPKVASQINRALVIVVFGALGILALAVIFLALEPKTPTHAPLKLKVGGALSPKQDTLFSNLPGSYADAKAIKALMGHHQQALPKAVVDELKMLKAQQESLKAQLLTMQKAKPIVAPPPPPPSPLDREAITSPLFFPGGAPMPLPKKPITKKSTKDAKKSTDNKESTAGENAYAKQNMQSSKINFFNSKPSKAIYNKAQVQFPLSKYILQAGEVIPAVLQTEIISDNPGMIVAIVNQDVYDNLTGRYLLIPKGTKLIGKYSSKISYHQSTLQAAFMRLIRPDGTSIVLQSMPGVNGLGVSGFSDSVNNHWGLIIGSAVLSAVFNLPAIVATNQMNNDQWEVPGGPYPGYQRPPSMGSTAKASALQSLGQSASDIGGKITSKALALQPTITIHAGYKFAVIVNKDIILPPYQTPFASKSGG